MQRAERSHQLDQLGATRMGSLRIQETYRIDPNDLRNLPPGVAWITTAGRAAKAAIAASPPPRTSLTTKRRSLPEDELLPPAGTATLGGLAAAGGPEEISIVAARLAPAFEQQTLSFGPIRPRDGAGRHRPARRRRRGNDHPRRARP